MKEIVDVKVRDRGRDRVSGPRPPDPQGPGGSLHAGREVRGAVGTVAQYGQKAWSFTHCSAVLVLQKWKLRPKERSRPPPQGHSDGLGVEEVELGPEPRAQFPALPRSRWAGRQIRTFGTLCKTRRDPGAWRAQFSLWPPPFSLPAPWFPSSPASLSISPIPRSVYLKSSLLGSF